MLSRCHLGRYKRQIAHHSFRGLHDDAEKIPKTGGCERCAFAWLVLGSQQQRVSIDIQIIQHTSMTRSMQLEKKEGRYKGSFSRLSTPIYKNAKNIQLIVFLRRERLAMFWCHPAYAAPGCHPGPEGSNILRFGGLHLEIKSAHRNI